jgi:hypothetical protein
MKTRCETSAVGPFGRIRWRRYREQFCTGCDSMVGLRAASAG